MKTLFINACVRENSRTLLLAREILRETVGEICEIELEKEGILPLTRATLARRDDLLARGAFDDPMLRYAKQFAEADEIVVAAPFWDLSFPAALKCYFEHVTVSGITFRYQNGHPIGLCRAKRLIYVTTSGGMITADFGYSYVKALATGFYGIGETVAHRAMNLDVECISCEELLQRAKISVVK